MKRKHTILYLTLIVLLLVAVAIFYLFSNKLDNQQDLTKYMPNSTLFFAEYNLKNKDLVKYFQDNANQIKLQKVINQSGLFNNLSYGLLEELDKVALVIVNNQDQQEKIWILQSQNIHKLAALTPAGYFESNLDSNTIALAKNRELFKLINTQDVLSQQAFEQRTILNKFSNHNFLNLYFSSDYLQHLSKNSNLIYHLILNNLGVDNSSPAFLGVATKNNQITYDFFSKNLSSSSAKKFSKEFKSEFSKLNFNKNDFFNFASADLGTFLQDLKNNLTQEQIKELESKYDFKWKDLENILNHPGFIFTDRNSNLITNKDIFNLEKYDYLLAIKMGNIDNTEIIEKIKNVIKNILGYKYPSYKTKKLPDRTPSIEIVADPTIFEFETDNTIDSIEFSAVKIAISQKDDYLLVSNNKEFLQEYLNFSLPEESVLNCDLNAQDEIVVLNTKRIYQSFLNNLNQIIININKNKKDLELNGCFNF